MKLNLFITGSNGLFGKSLIKYLKKKKIKFKTFNRKNYKKYNHYNFDNFLKLNNFSHIINLAAITNVDQCEKNKKLTKDVNINFLKKICDSIKKSKKNIKLIQFSTDQMYFNYKLNNEKNTKIKNYYTKSKIEAEKQALKINSIVLRTNFFGKSLSKDRFSFSDWIYLNLRNKKNIYLADDLYFSPLSIDTLCQILLKILKIQKNGIFNLGSLGGKSRYKFGLEFSKLLKLDLKLIKKVKKNKLNLYAKRNHDMRMIVKKFERNFKIKLPSLQNEIIKEAKNYAK